MSIWILPVYIYLYTCTPNIPVLISECIALFIYLSHELDTALYLNIFTKLVSAG